MFNKVIEVTKNKKSRYPKFVLMVKKANKKKNLIIIRKREE